MEVQYLLKDDIDLVYNIKQSMLEVVLVEIALPSFLDVTTLLALYRRMTEISVITKKKLRLITKTNNLLVEKYVTRLFAQSDSVFITIDWR